MFVASAKLRMITLEQRPERKAVGVRFDRRPVEGWNMVALSDIWVSLMRGVKSSSPPPPTGGLWTAGGGPQRGPSPLSGDYCRSILLMHWIGDPSCPIGPI